MIVSPFTLYLRNLLPAPSRSRRANTDPAADDATVNFRRILSAVYSHRIITSCRWVEHAAPETLAQLLHAHGSRPVGRWTPT